MLLVWYPAYHCIHNHKQNLHKSTVAVFATKTGACSATAVAPLLVCTAVAARRATGFEIQMECIGFVVRPSIEPRVHSILEVEPIARSFVFVLIWYLDVDVDVDDRKCNIYISLTHASTFTRARWRRSAGTPTCVMTYRRLPCVPQSSIISAWMGVVLASDMRAHLRAGCLLMNQLIFSNQRSVFK